MYVFRLSSRHMLNVLEIQYDKSKQQPREYYAICHFVRWHGIIKLVVVNLHDTFPNANDKWKNYFLKFVIQDALLVGLHGKRWGVQSPAAVA